MHVEVYIPFVCAILCCVLYSGCQGLGLNQCVSGYLEVLDTLQSVEDALTCKGIPASDTLRWTFRPKNHAGAPLRIGSCEPHSLHCKLQLSPNNPIFTIRRPSDDVSHLSLAREVSRNLAGATFYCLSESDSTDCRVDIVYPAEGVNCTAQFDSSPSTQWTLSGRCDVKKIYSALNRYSCTWYESDGTSQKPVDTSFVTFSPTPSSADFSSGPCSVTEKPMSTACKDLEYNYRVKISPGSGKTEVSFAGSNVIVTEPDHNETECGSSDASPRTGVYIGIGVGIACVIAVIAALIVRKTRQAAEHDNVPLIVATDSGQAAEHDDVELILPTDSASRRSTGQAAEHDDVQLVEPTDSGSRRSTDSAEQEQESGHGNRTPESPDPGKSKQATIQTEQAHSTEAVGGSKDSSSDNVKEESISNNEPSPTQNNKPQNEIPSDSHASSTDNGRNEKEVTVHPTQPPKTTQPPSPPTTSAPLTTSSRVTTATDVTANQMTAAPVMSQVEVTTTVHETIASPAPTTRIHVASAAVPTDGTNANGSVTTPGQVISDGTGPTEESSSNNEPSSTQNNKPQNEIPSHSDASSTDNGRSEKAQSNPPEDIELQIVGYDNIHDTRMTMVGAQSTDYYNLRRT